MDITGKGHNADIDKVILKKLNLQQSYFPNYNIEEIMTKLNQEALMKEVIIAMQQ